VIFNIPSDLKELKGAGDLVKNLAPKEAIQSNNEGGFPGHVSPFPLNDSAHQYMVTVWDLKLKISVDKSVGAAYLGFNIFGRALTKASIVI